MVRNTEITIHQKVFSNDDMLRIFDFFADVYKETLNTVKHDFEVSLMIQLRDVEGISYTIKDNEAHDEIKNLIKIKKVVLIYCRLSSHSMDASIDLMLKEGESGSIKIQSSDVDWLASKKAKLEEIIKDACSQQNFYIKNRRLLLFVSSVVFGFLYYSILHFAGRSIKSKSSVDTTDQHLLQLIIIVMLYLVGTLLTLVIFPKLDKLWPDIEFDFGPRQRRTSQNRKKIWAIISVFVFPTILAVVMLFL